jgi:hypothetical protein
MIADVTESNRVLANCSTSSNLKDTLLAATQFLTSAQIFSIAFNSG